MPIVGLDIGKNSVTACQIQGGLPTDLNQFARTYKPLVLGQTSTDLAKLLSLGDSFALESTGDYSKFWLNQLRQNGKTICLVGARKLKNLREINGINSKSDRYDAAFLAVYAYQNRHNPYRFDSLDAERIRYALLQRASLVKMANSQKNRIWQLLSYQWPEATTSKTGRKPGQIRRWLEPNPPGLFRFLAGEPVHNKKSRQISLSNTLGTGLEPITKTLASQLCSLERQELELELEIDRIICGVSDFQPYLKVFDQHGFGPALQAALLGCIFPFQRYLNDDGTQHIYRVPSQRNPGRSHRRNKSLGAFKLALGQGTVIKQSGSVSKHVAGGSKFLRTALYQHVKIAIVMPKKIKPGDRLAEHAAYYRSLGPTIPHHKAVGKVSGRIAKDLYRDLLGII